jgi:hypothetical protein
MTKIALSHGHQLRRDNVHEVTVLLFLLLYAFSSTVTLPLDLAHPLGLTCAAGDRDTSCTMEDILLSHFSEQ